MHLLNIQLVTVLHHSLNFMIIWCPEFKRFYLPITEYIFALVQPQVFGKLLFETPLGKGVLILFAALFLAAGTIPLLCAVFPQMPYMWNLVKQ